MKEELLQEFKIVAVKKFKKKWDIHCYEFPHTQLEIVDFWLGKMEELWNQAHEEGKKVGFKFGQYGTKLTTKK